MFYKGEKSSVKCDMNTNKLESLVALFHAIKQVKSETDITTEMENSGGLVGLLIGREINILPL